MKDIKRNRDLMEELNIMLEKAMKDDERIELFHGRPLRKNVITKEDITDLKIALNCSENLEEFLGQV